MFAGCCLCRGFTAGNESNTEGFWSLGCLAKIVEEEMKKRERETETERETERDRERLKLKPCPNILY